MDYRETKGMVIYSDTDNTGYETAVRDFPGIRTTAALTDSSHRRRKDGHTGKDDEAGGRGRRNGDRVDGEVSVTDEARKRNENGSSRYEPTTY